MKNLLYLTRKLEAEGYTTQFKMTEDGLLSLSTDTLYTPNDLKVVNFYRYEGCSDPEDNAILYAIETNSGEQGSLIDAYGSYSDPLVGEFFKLIVAIEKKIQ